MKKTIACVLAATLVLLCGCDSQKTDTGSVSVEEQYYSYAQDCIKKGDTETAVAVLKEGIEKTNSAKLQELLSSVKPDADQTDSTTAETTTTTTTTATTAKKENANWSKEYAKFMNDYTDEYFDQAPIDWFCLFDMNDDQIPELLFHTEGITRFDSYVHFAAMEHEKTVEIGDVLLGEASLCGLEKESAVLIHSCIMGEETIEKCVVMDGKLYTTVLYSGEMILYDELLPLKDMKTTDYYYGIKKVSWKHNPKDRNDKVLKDYL